MELLAPHYFFKAEAEAFGSKLNIWSPIWSFKLAKKFLGAGAGAFSSNKNLKQELSSSIFCDGTRAFACFVLDCNAGAHAKPHFMSNPTQFS